MRLNGALSARFRVAAAAPAADTRHAALPAQCGAAGHRCVSKRTLPWQMTNETLGYFCLMAGFLPSAGLLAISAPLMFDVHCPGEYQPCAVYCSWHFRIANDCRVFRSKAPTPLVCAERECKGIQAGISETCAHIRFSCVHRR